MRSGAVTGHNLGVSRAFFEEVGGFDESFARYGGEDTELGYRAQMRGGLLVPARDAFGWHQGRWAEGRAGKEREQELQGGKLANLVADPGFRPAAPGRGYPVPRHVVVVEAGDAPVGRLVESAEALLADAETDLAVCVEAPEAPDARRRLEEALGPDPRVRVSAAGAALDAFPVSPFHITLPAGAVPGRGLVRGLRSALGDAATATAVLAGGGQASIARAWALHRARRAGGSAADYGEARRIAAGRLALGRVLPVIGRAGRGRRRRGARAVAARVWAEARHVRGVRTGWRFAGWLATGLRWWLRQGGRTGTTRSMLAPFPEELRARGLFTEYPRSHATIGSAGRSAARGGDRGARRLRPGRCSRRRRGSPASSAAGMSTWCSPTRRRRRRASRRRPSCSARRPRSRRRPSTRRSTTRSAGCARSSLASPRSGRRACSRPACGRTAWWGSGTGTRSGTATTSRTWPRSTRGPPSAPAPWPGSPPAGCRCASPTATPCWRRCSAPSSTG